VDRALFNQGFARRASAVNFGTLLEFGEADLAVHVGPYDEKSEHKRVIEVPLEVVSGRVEISGPEEQPNQSVVELPVGSYRLVAAQTVKDENREAVELYFQRLAQALTSSRIIVADEGLRPPSPLLENAEVA